MVREKKDCLICERIALIKSGKNPFFVAELETGYVVIGDHQLFRGYSLFLSKKHARELHEVPPIFRKKFLWEMSIVAEAVNRAFKPIKMNYELLGNTDEHLHWHLFPRRKSDQYPESPVWRVKKQNRNANSVRPSANILEDMVLALRLALQK